MTHNDALDAMTSHNDVTASTVKALSDSNTPLLGMHIHI